MLLHGAKRTNCFVEADQLLAELLEAMKLSHLLLRFVQRGGVGKGLGYGLASHSSGKAKLGIMAGVLWLGAMAGRFATAPAHGRNRTRAKIAQREEFLQEPGSIGLQGSERITHGVSSYLSVSIRSDL